MKKNFPALTIQLIKAILYKYGQVLLYSTEQKVSETTGKVYTEYRLYLSVTTQQYNEMFPNAKLNPFTHKSKYAKLLLKKTIQSREVFMFLLEEIWYKLESGEALKPSEEAAKYVKF